MSRTEHVQVARRSSPGIALWREEHPQERLDLSGANLSNLNLNRADLSGADLSGADLLGVRLNQANLRRADLKGAVAVIGQLTRADLREADLSGATLRRCDLTGADLAGANLSGANLSGAVLRGASLENALAAGANLSGADLSGAGLGGADLSGADLSNAGLAGADLTGANLSRATFYRTSLASSIWRGAVMFHTVFGDCDLSQAVGLDRADHQGPSALGLDTLSRSGGTLPPEFLRGTGAPESAVEYMNAVSQAPDRFYTCFISCCTGDLEFTQRLQAGLQARGVRCWYHASDARGGPWTSGNIDRGIRYYDKLAVVCSEKSLANELLREGVSQGIERQNATGRWLFYPVAVSDAVYNRRNRNVRLLQLWRYVTFDFRAWEEASAYDDALESLAAGLNGDQEASAGLVPLEEDQG